MTTAALVLAIVAFQTPLSTQPTEHDLARGAQDRYTIVLAAGEYARVTVEQKGIDLVVDVMDPANGLLGAFQDVVGPEGTERVDVAAPAAGTYTLVVKAAAGAIATGRYVIRVDARRAAAGAERTLQESRSARTAGQQLEAKGRYADARPLFEKALGLAELAVGPRDPAAGLIVFDLAGNALERFDDENAQALYERAARTLEAAWGSASPYPAMARSRLALVYERLGQRQKAEPLIREVLPILERTLGPDHPWHLRSLETLANLRDSAGDAQQAEAINRRVLAALDRTGQTGTMLEATALNNLADLYRQKNDFAQAEPLFTRSIAIGASIVGDESLFVANGLQNLGIIARQRKDYAAAADDYRRSLAIRETLLGPDHPIIAGLLTNLGALYRATGDDARALDAHFRALGMWEKSFGPYSRETLLSVGNIARTYAGMGDVANALVFQRRADAILETQMGLYVAGGSERQKLAFVRSESERTDRTISLHLLQAPGNADAASLAALVLLQRKGRVQDAMTDIFAAVRQRVADTADRALLDSLKDTTAQLARVALASMPPKDGAGSAAAIEQKKEQLEATLSEHSAEFRAEITPVTLEAVQAAIPADAALIEYAVFRPFDPGAERNEEAYGPPHYAAYVIKKHDPPIGFDLGATEDIDLLIGRLRDALHDPGNDTFKTHARALDERVMRPLRASLGGATRLLISPDGALNLVPFDALADEHGRFLIERYASTYLTSGRDLLRMHIPRAMPGKAVIIADPLFGEPVVKASPVRIASKGGLRSVTGGPDMKDLYFAPLSGSAAEGRAIKALFPGATLVTGRRATKEALEHVQAPRILHIASHGFFLDDDREGAGVQARNPLLRSGLALAGANLPGGQQGPGILTALEAAGLDLWGTKLVTLSACDTGVGEVRNGEGVYGLRRAFTLAGAETLVMSLWPVSDAVARDTMVAYYARLRTGLGRGDALRQAKLAILKRPALRHPYFWAGFIQSGDWTSLYAS